MRNVLLMTVLCVFLMQGIGWGEELKLKFDNTVFEQNIVIGDIDLTQLLERCREFIEDNTEDLYRVVYRDSVYRIITREGQLEDKIKEIKQALDKATRETQLRKDIEKALKILTGGK